MLPQNNPDRIRILFDDHRLVANAGLLLPATLARHPGLRELVDHHLDLGGAPGRANTGDKMLTLVASALAGGACIDDADALGAGRWWDGRCSRLRGQGAIHPGDLPAQLPVGACPSTRPREPPVVGPGLGRWGRTRRLAPDHRPGLDHAVTGQVALQRKLSKQRPGPGRTVRRQFAGGQSFRLVSHVL